MENLITKGFFKGFDALIFASAISCLFQINDKTQMVTTKLTEDSKNRGSIVYTREEPVEASDVVTGAQVLSEVWDYSGDKRIYINSTEVTSRKQEIEFLSGKISMTGRYIKIYENAGTTVRYKKI